MATTTSPLYEIVGNVTNEITGEPHIHYYTYDIDKAHALTYAFTSGIGVACDVRVWTTPCVECWACETARRSRAEEYR